MPVRSFSIAERILTERQRLERPLMLLIWIAILSHSLSLGQLFYALAGTLAVGVNLLAATRAKELFVSRLFINVGVLLATAILVIELFFSNIEQLTALGHYLILILICKLFERKSNRDYVQMLFLSLLLMVAASLNTSDMWFGMALTTFVVLTSYAGMVFTLKRGLDTAASAVLVSETSPPSVQRIAWNVVRSWPAAALRRKLVLMLLTVAWITLLGFLFLPRWAVGGTRSDPSDGSQTSFYGHLRLGQPRQIYLSKEVMLRARFSDQWPHEAIDNWGYLRAQVLDVYRYSAVDKASVWDRTPSVQVDPSSMQLPVPREKLLPVTISMSTNLGIALFGVYPTVQLRADPDDLKRFKADNSLCWTELPDGSPQWLQYEALTLPAYARAKPLWARDQSGYSDRPLNVDTLHEPRESRPYGPDIVVPQRVKELAATWCSDILDQRDRAGLAHVGDYDMMIAQRIAQHLRNEYDYTLDLSDANPSRDAVEDFLFYLKRGHCEYFASAMTVMCQSLDVRARMATGFHLTEDNRREDGTYEARGLDAHAWTEVYSDSGGWQVVDATSSHMFSPGMAGPGSWLKGVYQSITKFWQEKIVGYDLQSQQSLAQWLKSAFQAAYQNAVNWLRSVGAGFERLLLTGEVDWVLLHLLIALAVAGVGLYALVVWRTLRNRRRQQLDPGYRLEFFRRLQRLMDRHGAGRALGQTVSDQLAAAIAKGWPADLLQDLLALYQRMRWGQYAAGTEELKQAHDKVAQIETQIKRSTPIKGM